MKLIEQDKVVSLLKPVALAATATTGTAVKINLLEDDCIAICHVGTPAGTASALAVIIEASTAATSGGSYTTVGAFTVAATAAAGIAAVGVNLAKENWVRAKIAMTSADTTTSLPISVTLIGKLDYEANTINSATVA